MTMVASTEAGLAQVQRPRTWIAPVAAFVIVLIVAAVVAPSFFQIANLGNLSRQVAILGVVAAGQTIVLLVRGIDLSVAAVISLSMVMVARVTGGDNSLVWVAIGIALIMGLLVGLLNAFLVVVRRVPPFVATLALGVLVAGAQVAWTQGVPGGEVPSVLADFGSSRMFGVPLVTVVGVLLVLILGIILKFTIVGRWVYSVGSNPAAARVAGLPVSTVTTGAYAASAMLAVVTGILLGSYIGYVDAYLGAGYDLDSIAAAVIGGTTFAGGKGGVGRSLLGALIIGAALNIIVLSGAAEWLQLVVKGGVIVLAVAVQSARWGRRNRV
jgi:ribose/xylose/arabinose/galactoside ABC-type transport system permease subunit